jgi:hypothetical protein
MLEHRMARPCGPCNIVIDECIASGKMLQMMQQTGGALTRTPPLYTPPPVYSPSELLPAKNAEKEHGLCACGSMCVFGDGCKMRGNFRVAH